MKMLKECSVKKINKFTRNQNQGLTLKIKVKRMKTAKKIN
jgi:hypothetical protein